MRRAGLVLLALVAGYGAIFGLGELLLSGDYATDPNGSGCESLTAASESDVQPAVVILALLFGGWTFALGFNAVRVFNWDLQASIAQTWRLTMAVVVGLFCVCLGAVVYYHDGLAFIYVIFAAPPALLIRLFAAVSIVAGTRRERGLGRALGDQTGHVLLDIVLVVVFLVVAAVALGGLFAGPLNPISEVSTC